MKAFFKIIIQFIKVKFCRSIITVFSDRVLQMSYMTLLKKAMSK